MQRDVSSVFKKSLVKTLAFAKKDTHELMTPLVQVFSLRDTTTVAEAIALCREEGYSSIPVFQKRGFNIVGLVTYHDLMMAKDLTASLMQIMHPVAYVAEEMGVKDLFSFLRELKKSFAVVVDEYGSAVGVVTLEDIIEEILGEIEDEYDEVRSGWKMTAPNQYLFNGRVKIDDINERLRWRLPKENYETLAGFLLVQFGHIPKSGEILHYGSLTFLVKSATPRTLDEILVEIG
jgi:CBS domain containing-hemolysin-like protein